MNSSPSPTSKRPPQIMGILNCTPDSFSDGGTDADPQAACDRALKMLSDGADILDIGGESTRPGADPVPVDEEIRRVAPIIAAIRKHSDCAISIDTMKPEVARAAFAAGADIWNDVTALRYAPESAKTAAELKAFVILMHMQGDPRTMQAAPNYPRGVTAEVLEFFAQRILVAQEAGIARDKLMVDPGIGFGKSPAHNLTLLADTGRLCELGLPVLIGASRKRFIDSADGHTSQPNERLGGSLASAIWAASMGARIIRVHDVRQTSQALKVWSAISTAEQ